MRVPLVSVMAQVGLTLYVTFTSVVGKAGSPASAVNVAVFVVPTLVHVPAGNRENVDGNLCTALPRNSMV